MINVTKFNVIKALLEDGVPLKAIARQAGVDVRTVRRYRSQIAEGDREPIRRQAPTKLEPWRDRIAAKVEKGLSAVQIWQDLRREPGFTASRETVGRLVAKMQPVRTGSVYCRLRFAPGEEAQIDFGEVGRLLMPDGRRRRCYLFVMTLCHSRFAYYDLVTDQTVPTFLGAIARGFAAFGGAPLRVKPDNLRSAVLCRGLEGRLYQQDFFNFCRHHGTLPDAARPWTPTDKGRVERDIGYAKGNWWKGREHTHYAAARADLARWQREIANVRDHGTTRRRPIDLLEECERAALRPLPTAAYELAEWSQYLVRKDGYVRIHENHYSVPHTLLGRTLVVRLSEASIEVFDEENRVAVHDRLPRDQRGQTVTDLDHRPEYQRLATQEVHRQRVAAIRGAGSHASELLGRLRGQRWVFGDQVRRFHALLVRYGAVDLELAARRAIYYEATDGVHRLERILERGLQHRPLPDVAAAAAPVHGEDFGRPLAEYGELLPEELR